MWQNILRNQTSQVNVLFKIMESPVRSRLLEERLRFGILAQKGKTLKMTASSLFIVLYMYILIYIAPLTTGPFSRCWLINCTFIPLSTFYLFHSYSVQCTSRVLY